MKSRNLFGITSALVLVIFRVGATSNICDSPGCVQEAAKVLEYVDPSVNPCDNFYQFACGKFLKNAHGNTELTFWKQIEDKTKYELLEIYQEDIHEDDHKMVKAVKKFYRSCMDEDEIKPDFVKTMKKILKAVGGWPVVEGSNWNEEGFNWLTATYELRRLGYDFSAVIGVEVQPADSNKNNILQVFQKSHYISTQEDLRNIATAAVLLGASDEESVLKKLTDTYNAVRNMDQNVGPIYTEQTVEEIQKSDGIIDWLEFLRNIAGPKISISKTDYIQFPKDQYIKNGIELFSKLPKRVQANYILSEVVKPIFRFVYTKKDIYGDTPDTVAEYCLRITSEAFATSGPNPADVIRLRRYLSKEKKAKIEEMVLTIKSALTKIINSRDWLHEIEKKVIVNEIEEFDVIIGLSENYFEDKILDETDVDMVGTEDDSSFFNLLAQATRNQQTAKYTNLKRPSEDLNKRDYDSSSISMGRNWIYVPSVITEVTFDETKPAFVNHGTLGTLISKFILDIIWKNMNSKENQIKQCILEGLNNSTLHVLRKEIIAREAIGISRGALISRNVYEEWTKINGEEPKLVAAMYTPKQLFWISLGRCSCDPVGVPTLTGMMSKAERHQMRSDMLTESLRLIPTFAEDFNCPVNSRLNPSSKCNIF